jgi:hypothetical protein
MKWSNGKSSGVLARIPYCLISAFSTFMMKFLAILLLFAWSHSYGQRRHVEAPFGAAFGFDQFRKEDSLEGIYTDIASLNVITDTLPIYSDDEMDAWRHMQIEYYYYDSTNSLKKVYFRNGQGGSYYFWFEGTCLKKARHLRWPSDLKYDFSEEENRSTPSEIERRIASEPEKKQSFETLKMARNFLEKFQTLL